MSLHVVDVKRRLVRFLQRKETPAWLRAEQAQADEIEALVAAVVRRAPHDPQALADWWARMEAALDERCGRRWPAARDIAAVAAECGAPEAPGPVRSARETDVSDPAELAAGRMRAGEPVGEGWLYGIGACEIVARGLVDRDTMQRYRTGAYRARRALLGEDAALRWVQSAEADHERATAVWRARNDLTLRRDAADVSHVRRMGTA